MTRWKSQTFAVIAVAIVTTMVPSSSVASATPESATRVVRLTPHIQRGATALGRLPDDHALTFDVVLSPTHTDELQTLLDGQRDPSSPLYGHYLARGQFLQRFGPSAQQVAAVTTWLRGAGLHDITVDGFAVKVRTNSGTAARALGVSMERYRTTASREIFSSRDAPLLPPSIAGNITSILGLTNAAAAQPRLDSAPQTANAAVAPHADGLTPCSAATTAAGSKFYTPDQVGARYGVGDLFDHGQSGIDKTVALVEFAPHLRPDTDAYFTCFGLTKRLTAVLVDGGGTPDSGGSNGSLEANIDIEEVATQAPDASIVSYEAPNTDQGAFDVYNRIVTDNTAQAISISWGFCEAGTGAASRDSISTLLAQAAAQGQTAVAATGDSGSEDCFAGGNGPTTLAVDSPASDPNITGAGGTSLNTSTEPVWNDCVGSASFAACGGSGGAGGGGLSAVYARPSWQPAVGGTACPLAMATCRQVPDVSANAGVGEIFRSGGTWLAVGGTSIAAPKIAAIAADVNGACTARVGQLAPKLVMLAALGGYGTALKDVTVGNNDLTRTHANQFPAAAGNDLATGLGVPIAAGWSCPQIASLSSTQAAAGTSLTITGFALASASIKFGTVTAAVTARTPTSLTVTVPAGTGTVAVQGTNAIGSGTATVAFSYPGAVTTTTTTTTTSTTTTTTTAPPTTTTTTTVPPTKTAPRPKPVNTRSYRTVASDGGIFDFGGARFYGSTGNIPLNQPIVGMTTDRATGGYWFVARDGGIFGFHAPFLGSTGGAALDAPVIGMAATTNGKGYWVATASGRVHAFGTAANLGGVAHPHAPIVGIAPTSTGKGYWLAGRDGSIYAFGDAHNYGSMFGTPLTQPVVGIAADPATGGYWMVASDGGIFGFHAPFFGSTGALPLNQPIVGIAATHNGRGYWMVARDGGIFSFGNARFSGSMGGLPLNRPMVGMAPAE